MLGAPLGLVATCRRSQGWACHCLVRNPHQQPAATAHVQQCPAFKRPRGVRRDPEMVLNAGPDKADPRLAATRGGNRGRAAQGMGQRVNAPWVPPSWSRRKRSVRPVSSGGCVPGGNSQQGAPSHAHPAPRAGGQRRVRPALACATTACLRGGANGGRGGGRPPKTGPAGGGGAVCRAGTASRGHPPTPTPRPGRAGSGASGLRWRVPLRPASVAGPTGDEEGEDHPKRAQRAAAGQREVQGGGDRARGVVVWGESGAPHRVEPVQSPEAAERVPPLGAQPLKFRDLGRVDGRGGPRLGSARARARARAAVGAAACERRRRSRQPAWSCGAAAAVAAPCWPCSLLRPGHSPVRGGHGGGHGTPLAAQEQPPGGGGAGGHRASGVPAEAHPHGFLLAVPQRCDPSAGAPPQDARAGGRAGGRAGSLAGRRCSRMANKRCVTARWSCAQSCRWRGRRFLTVLRRE